MGKRATQPKARRTARGGGARSSGVRGLTRRIVPKGVPRWAMHPEFWAVLAVGATFRLLWPSDAEFLGDQAQLLALGRSAFVHGTFPATGIRASLGFLNMPMSVWAYWPFALVGGALAATVATMLANVLAVVLLYATADRYTGRWVAFAATLLYAVMPWPVSYARFIWQQNLLAPVVVLFLLTLLRGAVDRAPGWLVPNLACWIVATQLHPVAAPMLGLTLLGLAFCRSECTARRVLPGVALVAVLLLPTALWEVGSGFADVKIILHEVPISRDAHGIIPTPAEAPSVGTPIAVGGLATPAHVVPPTGLVAVATHAPAPTLWDTLTHSPAAVQLLATLSLYPRDAFGAGSSYATTYAQLAWVTPVLLALYLASTLWLGATVIWQGLLRGFGELRTPRGGARRLATALPRAIADPHWRLLAVLAAWNALPLVVMSRSATPVYQHYMLFVLPIIPLIEALFLRAVVRAAVRAFGRGAASRRGWALAADVAGLVLVAALALPQGIATAAGLGAQHDDPARVGQAGSYYSAGITLAVQQRLLHALRTAAPAPDAPVLLGSTGLLQQPLGYAASTDAAPMSVYTGDTCLLVPAADGRAVSAASMSVVGSDVLKNLSGAQAVGTGTDEDGRPMPIFRVQPGAHLADERAVAPPAGVPASAPHLAAYRARPANDGLDLILAWEGAPPSQRGRSDALSFWYGAAPGADAPSVVNVAFFAQPLDATGHPVGAITRADCNVVSWSPGLRIYSWRRLPSTGDDGRAVATWRTWAVARTAYISRPALGPLTLESGDVRFLPERQLGPALDLPARATTHP